MDITAIGSVSLDDSILKNMLKNKVEDAGLNGIQTVFANPVHQSPAQATQNTSAFNPMAQNFVSSGQEESKYLKAKKAAFQSDSNMNNRQNSILNSSLAELGANDSGSYAKRILVGKKAARRIQEEMNTSIREESEKNLEKISKQLKQKTEEQLAPKNEKGEPIPGLNPDLPSNSAPEIALPELDIPSQTASENIAPKAYTDPSFEQAATSKPALVRPDLPQLDTYI